MKHMTWTPFDWILDWDIIMDSDDCSFWQIWEWDGVSIQFSLICQKLLMSLIMASF